MSGYNAIARYLHWLVAGLVTLQFVLAEFAESAEELGKPLQQLAITANHKSVGMTVLMLALLRLVWRLTHPIPTLPNAMPRWQQHSANIAHWLLYSLIFLIPITGWLMSSASAYSVSWFNLFTFPDLVASNPSLKDTFEEIHETLAKGLFVLALGHIAAGLWHHFWDKDDVLRRISSVGSLVLGALVLAGGVASLRVDNAASGNVGVAQEIGQKTEKEVGQEVAQPIVELESVVKTSSLPLWVIDQSASSIVFSAEQAGAIFEGRFDQWQAQIRFQGDVMDQSHATVSVALASVDTKDSDRDGTLAAKEWFNGGTAIFQASEFNRVSENTFRTVNATLDFGQSAGAIDLEFTVERQAGRVTLLGSARLDRLDLGVGIGEWLDTTWVGQYVDVTVTVVADVSE